MSDSQSQLPMAGVGRVSELLNPAAVVRHQECGRLLESLGSVGRSLGVCGEEFSGLCVCVSVCVCVCVWRSLGVCV